MPFPRILLIEDEGSVRKLMAMWLSFQGYLVSEAPDGSTGLAELEHKPVDLAVVDLSLPDWNGWRLIDFIHRDRPKLPILAISGQLVFADHEDSLLDCGANASLGKPFTRDAFLKAVYALLDMWQDVTNRDI